MAKTAKQKERDLVDRLRGMGLRKQLARNLAHTATNVKGQLPDSARSAIKEMIAKVDDVGGRVSKKSKHPEQDADAPERDRKVAKEQAKKAGKTKAAKKAGKTKAAKRARKAAKKAKKKLKSA